MAKELKTKLDPNAPMVYAIRIAGTLGNEWAGWFEGIGHKRRHIGVPQDDVDFFSAEFAHDGAHPDSALADAGADRVNPLLSGGHRAFAAEARLSGDGFDFHQFFRDFRHFAFEEAGDQVRV